MPNVRYAGLLAQWPRSASNTNGWQERHMRAIESPCNHGEGTIVNLMRAWLEYADEHARHFETGIGQDYVLGPEWEAIGKAIRGLLNGDCGRLDCGVLDLLIRGVLQAESFGDE